MESNEKEQNAVTAAKPKSKFFASDKRLFIIIAVLIVLALIAVNVVPGIVAKKVMKSMAGKIAVTDPFEALINTAGGREAIDEKTAEDLITGITLSAGDISDNEQALIEQLPEEVRNKEFADNAEKAAFYNSLLASYNDKAKNTEQHEKFFEELSAVQFLTFLYNSENYIEKLEEMQAQAKASAAEEK